MQNFQRVQGAIWRMVEVHLGLAEIVLLRSLFCGFEKLGVFAAGFQHLANDHFVVGAFFGHEFFVGAAFDYFAGFEEED